MNSQVFLTYSLTDEREAAAIREELCRLGLDVWWDAELPTGTNWAREIGRALDRSDSMVVLVSPRAMASDLVARELDHAISHENFRDRIFPSSSNPRTVCLDTSRSFRCSTSPGIELGS